MQQFRVSTWKDKSGSQSLKSSSQSGKTLQQGKKFHKKNIHLPVKDSPGITSKLYSHFAIRFDIKVHPFKSSC